MIAAHYEEQLVARSVLRYFREVKIPRVILTPQWKHFSKCVRVFLDYSHSLRYRPFAC